MNDTQKKKISESLKGRKPWNTGLTKETDKRIKKMADESSKRKKGKPSGVEGKHWKLSKETREKQCLAQQKNWESEKGMKRKKYYKEINTGKNNPMYGKKKNEKTKEKHRQCSLKMWETKDMTERNKKISESMKGDKNSNWKDGITPFASSIRHLLEYNNWRLKVFERDNFTCQMPGCTNLDNYIEAHHIILFSKIIKKNNIKSIEEAINCKELWDINNGITLCKKCHRKVTNKENFYKLLFNEIVKKYGKRSKTISK